MKAKIQNSFKMLLSKNEELNIRKIRKARLCYVLAYAIELILFCVRGYFQPIKVSFLGIPGNTIVMAFHGLSCLVFILLWSNRFKHLIKIAVSIMFFGFVPFLLLPIGLPRLAFAIVAYIGLGGAVTAARCGYAFAANNAERVFGMLIMLVSNATVYFVDLKFEYNFVFKYIVPIVLLIAFSVCLFKFKEEDFEVKDEATSDDKKGIYWALAFFIAYFMFDGYIHGLIDTINRGPYLYFIIGVFVAVVIFAVSLLKFKLNAWHIWNAFYIFLVTMAVLAVFAKQLGTEKPFYLFGGLSLLGWPLAIYILACAQKQFANYRLLKQCTAVFVVVSPITTMSDDILEKYFPNVMPVVTLIVVLVTVISFLMLSPFSYKHLFSVEWMNDLHKEDMRGIAEKVEEKDEFEKFGLTPRQKEVAVLLLAAKTRRQISGELGLSESTVKTHTSDLYKKLGINSRVELFKMFGVTETEVNEE